MTDLEDLGLEDSPFSDFLGFELLLEEQDRELLSSVRAFMTREVEPVINDYWTRAEFPHDLVPGHRRARHRRPGVRRTGLPGSRRAGRRHGRDGARPGRPVDRHLHGRARRARDGLDQPVRLRRAARALAARDGPDGADRRLRADRARARLRHLRRASPRPPGATATTGSSTARRSGSATPPSPTWSSSGPATRTTSRSRASSSRRAPTGMTFDKQEDKIALRVVQNAEIHLHDVRVPEANRLQEADSFRATANVLRVTRMSVAWQATGCARGAFEHALRYTKARQQFGRPIASLPDGAGPAGEDARPTSPPRPR